MDLSKKNSLFILSFIALLVTGYCFWLTFPFRGGVAPDSMAYLSITHHLHAGQGVSVWMRLFSYTSDPIAIWPPALPFLWACLYALGIAPLEAGWLLNLCLLSANLIFIGFLIYRFAFSLWMALIGITLVFISTDWREYHLWLLSEPLFIWASLLHIFFLYKWLREKNIVAGVAAILCCACIPFIRYPGMIFIPAAALAILIFDESRWRRRLGKAIGFALLSSLPLMAWLVRNYVKLRWQYPPGTRLSELIFGSLIKEEAHANSLAFNFVSSWQALWYWFHDLTTRTYWDGAVFGVGLVACGWFVSRGKVFLKDKFMGITFLYILLNGAFIFLSMVFCRFSGVVPERYYVLVFTLMVILGMGVLSDLCCVLKQRMGRRFIFVGSGLLLVFGIWVFLKAFSFYAWAQEVRIKGVDRSNGMRYQRALTEPWFPDASTAALGKYDSMLKGQPVPLSAHKDSA